MKIQPYLLQALSPLHAGTGQSAGVIDLPIARMRATGIPFVPGSSVKGVLKDARRRALAPETDILYAVFGPDRAIPGQDGDVSGAEPGAIDHAGALIVGDARLLALPVRSFRGTFALASSPLLLHLARRDLLEAGLDAPPIPEGLDKGKRAARVVARSANSFEKRKDRIYLEELDLEATHDPAVDHWARRIAASLPEDERVLVEQRFVIVDDDTMSFLWDTATQVDTRVRIDTTTGVVAEGALWTEESLPPETLLIGLLAAHGSLRAKTKMPAGDILAQAVPVDGETLQLGGKATVGRGRCRMQPWTPQPRAARGGRS